MASEAIQLAQASLKNNHSTGTDREEANKEIIAKSITNRCFLWSRVFLEITNGNVQMVNEWIKEKDNGFGSFHENTEALRVIQYQIAHGEISAGLERACLLREFIFERGDENLSRFCCGMWMPRLTLRWLVSYRNPNVRLRSGLPLLIPGENGAR